MLVSSRYLVLALLIAFVYSGYFVRYGIFSLTDDEDSIVIQSLIRQEVKNQKLLFVEEVKPFYPSGGRTFGCSFLLFEELWRDCKTVALGRAGAPALTASESARLVTTVAPIAANPCAYLYLLQPGTRVDAVRTLGCGLAHRKYRLTIAYAAGQGRDTILIINGEIK